MTGRKPFTGLKLKSDWQNDFLAYVEQAAFASLIDEVSATPKPGLVDLHDSGAHKDMDYKTFELSAHAIVPYLKEMAGLGLTFSGPPEELFALLRPVGVEAEKAMFEATGGVNTHKGMIFSMGLAAAAGSILVKQKAGGGDGNQTGNGNQTGARNRAGGGDRHQAGAPAGDIFLGGSGEKILSLCSKLCRDPIKREFRQIAAAAAAKQSPRTHGEYLFVTYGCRGIRGEAADGFPAVRSCSLPVLRAAVCASYRTGGKPVWNDICLHTLLHLMAEVDDTNILYRTDYKTLSYVREQARQLLELGGGFTEEGKQALCQANLDFIEKNISPGGCADLLAITLFIWRLEQYRYES